MVQLTINYIKKCVHKPRSCSKKSDDFLNKITHLNLPEKGIDFIADISKVKNLTVLYLHYNNLQEIENLHKNDCLTHLYLQHNKIHKMKHFDSIKHLEKLYLGHNYISVVEGLDTITTLKELHVEFQQLPPGETLYFDPRTIQNLSKCLLILDISGNNISSINDLKGLKSIEKLNANRNALSDLPAICSTIYNWPRIKELDFQINEVVRQPKYRDKIIANTSILKTLDGKDINDITRSFIHRFELIKGERREKVLRDNEKQTPFSSEIASIAEHLPPNLRQCVSASVNKEAIPRAKSLTLSLMQVPVHCPGFLSDGSIVASNILQPRPSRRVSNAESIVRSRQKAERESKTNLPQLGYAIPSNSQSP